MRNDRGNNADLYLFLAGMAGFLFVMFYEILVPDNVLTWFLNSHPYVSLLTAFAAIFAFVGALTWLDARQRATDR